MNRKLKLVLPVLALGLAAGGIIGGTVAWLTDQTPRTENVFTVSSVDVELGETPAQYQMIPGWTTDKDPAATVTADSEDCYLFIKVEETGGNVTVKGREYTFHSFLAYALEESWLALDETAYPGIYYKVIDSSSQKGTPHRILGGGSYTDADGTVYTWAEDQVLTKPEVTKEMMEGAENNKPVLSFTAYAVQLWKSNTPAARFTPLQAWLLVRSGM